MILGTDVRRQWKIPWYKKLIQQWSRVPVVISILLIVIMISSNDVGVIEISQAVFTEDAGRTNEGFEHNVDDKSTNNELATERKESKSNSNNNGRFQHYVENTKVPITYSSNRFRVVL